MGLFIPIGLGDITVDWVLALVKHMNHFGPDEELRVRSVSINCQPNTEGVLSDICKVFIHVDKVVVKNDAAKKSFIHNLFIKIIPSQFRKLVTSHRLFDREIVLYSQVLPKLLEFAHTNSPQMKLKHFGIPTFLYGDVSTSGEGVLVLEDLTPRGFKTYDPSMMLMDMDHMSKAVSALAEFHALCISYEMTKCKSLPELYPILDAKHLMWLQDDLVQFLKTVSRSAETFLKSIPGEEITARKYAAKLRDPVELYDNELRRKSRFKSLQHGDSWHNNFLFHRELLELKVAIVDWQVSFYGHGPTDLCYLIYSTSTSLFRKKHLDALLKSYFHILVSTVHKLGVPGNAFDPSFEEFESDFMQSLPFCLLFCANAEDLTLRELPSQEPRRKADARKTSLATDKQIRDLEDSFRSKLGLGTDKRMTRALRRRNYLDICREAVRKGIL